MTDREVMQMALDAIEQITPDWRTSIDKHEQLNNSIEALRAALAQPDVPETAFGETEPVAWRHNFIDDVIIKNRPTDITCNAGRWTALYTSPPQREWVVLTDEEISEIWSIIEMQNDDMHELKKFARAIEAKLKEKNI